MKKEPASIEAAKMINVYLNWKGIIQLKGKDFLRIQDLNQEQMDMIIGLAFTLKEMHQDHEPLPRLLNNKTIALLFEKPSTRTRVSFDAGIALLGGHSVFIDKATTQMGRGEDWKDTALTLSQYCDAIMARVFPHKEVEAFAKYTTIPIINGLTDEDHPCQILSDMMTIKEHFGGKKPIHVMYTGVSDNVSNSLMVGCAIQGWDITIATPSIYPVDKKYLTIAKRYATKTGSRVRVTHEIPDKKILKTINVVYTDEWESMHMHLDKEKLKPILSKFQVNEKLLSLCAKNARMMHCLPAQKGEEVSPTIMYRSKSLVWEQAQNRMYAQMALLACLIR